MFGFVIVVIDHFLAQFGAELPRHRITDLHLQRVYLVVGQGSLHRPVRDAETLARAARLGVDKVVDGVPALLLVLVSL